MRDLIMFFVGIAWCSCVLILSEAFFGIVTKIFKSDCVQKPVPGDVITSLDELRQSVISSITDGIELQVRDRGKMTGWREYKPTQVQTAIFVDLTKDYRVKSQEEE